MGTITSVALSLVILAGQQTDTHFDLTCRTEFFMDGYATGRHRNFDLSVDLRSMHWCDRSEGRCRLLPIDDLVGPTIVLMQDQQIAWAFNTSTDTFNGILWGPNGEQRGGYTGVCGYQDYTAGQGPPTP